MGLDSIYQGSAEFGKFMSLIGMILLAAIGIWVIAMGILELGKSPYIDKDHNLRDPYRDGISMIIGGIILIGIGVLFYYLVHRFKFLAAAEGVGAAWQIIT